MTQIFLAHARTRAHTLKLAGHAELGGASCSVVLVPRGHGDTNFKPPRLHSPPSPSLGNPPQPARTLPSIKSVTPQTKYHLSRLAVAMATPFSRSLHPSLGLYTINGLSWIQRRVWEAWRCDVHLKTRNCARLSRSAGVGQYFLHQNHRVYPPAERWHFKLQLQTHHDTT